MSTNKDEEYSYDKFLSDSGDDYPVYEDLIGIFGNIAEDMQDEDTENSRAKKVREFFKQDIENSKPESNNEDNKK